MKRLSIDLSRKGITHATQQAKRIVALTRRAEDAEENCAALREYCEYLAKEVTRLRAELEKK